LPWAEQKQEIIKGVEITKMFDPQGKLLFRPPQGRLNLQQILFCRSQGITILMWTVDSLDYNRKMEKNAILERLKNIRFNGGEVVLFHDDNQVMLDILPEFIRWAKSKNLEFAV